MLSEGWRTVVITSKITLRTEKNNLLLIKDDKIDRIPLEHIKIIIFDSNSVSLSSGTISCLCKWGIKLLFCNEKHNPLSETIIFDDNAFSAGRLFEQINWKNDYKLNVWKKIIDNKVKNQYRLAAKTDEKRASAILEMLSNINDSNVNDIEANAARIYFKIIFGRGFNRRTESDINSALNYGYAIIMSLINKSVVAHGYNTALGINHCSIKNPFNLSCDLIEPFRPVVDAIVYINKGRDLDFDYKRELIELLNKEVKYNGHRTELQNAIECFVQDVLKELSDGNARIGEINFAET